MTAAWIWARQDLWRRRLSWGVLALLIGLLGGSSLAALVGAHRTGTSFARFSRRSNADDWRVVYDGAGNPATPVLNHLAALMETRCLSPVGQPAPCTTAPHASNVIASATDAAPFRMIALALVDPKVGQERLGVSAFVPDPARGGLFTSVDRPKVIAGRRPDPHRADQVAVTPDAARSLHVRVGSTISVRALPLGQVDRDVEGLFSPARPARPSPSASPSGGPVVTLTVVGVETAPGDREFTGGSGNLHLSPAFMSRWRDLPYRQAIAVIAQPRALHFNIQRGLHNYIRGYPIDLYQADVGAARVRRSTQILAGALNSFGLLLGVVAVVALAQGLIRQLEHGVRDEEVLRALGMTRRERQVGAVAQAFVVGVAGGFLGIVVAAIASLFTPIGVARVIEPSPGFAIDLPWMVAGWAAIVAVTTVLAAASSWSISGGRAALARQRIGSRPSGRVTARMMAWGRLPVSAVFGVSLATRRTEHRRRSAAVAVVGSVLAVGTAAGALSFDAGLSQLLSTPRLYGWNWDAYIGNPFRGLTPAQTEQVDALLIHDAAVAGFSQGIFSGLEVATSDKPGLAPTSFPVGGLDNIRGDVLPPVLDALHGHGTTALALDQIVLGNDTLHLYHLRVGDWVQLRSPAAASHPFEGRIQVVGREVIAHLVGNQSSGPLGNGGLMSLAGFERFLSGPKDPPLSVNEFLVRFRPGTRAGPELEKLRSELEEPLGLDVRGPQPPTDISNVGQIDHVPSLLAAILIGAAAVMLGHALITSIRKSRRDFAIVRTLGFVRGQVVGAILSQSTCLVAVGIVIGWPLGLLAGTWQWHHFTTQVGFVPTAPITPVVAILIIPLMLLLANVVALIPGLRAVQQRPASELRFE